MRCKFLSCCCALEVLGAAGGMRSRPAEMSIAERVQLRDEVFRAYRHAYGSYITHAYPADELMPLSCEGRHWKLRTRGTIDDALGGYALTMVDSLDMHAIVGDGGAFREAVGTLLRDFDSGVLSFDRDVVVSVFEASIRVLGGLLSAHQIATELGQGSRLGPPGWYEGGLLPLAYDLGSRLLPAFDTPLGIPVHRVNLRTGVPGGETRDTCSAAAGTFLVEFGALSRLTGDASFETAARRAVAALWGRRSSLGLVGGGVAGTTGKWKSDLASIGAGTDSFYEYLLKSSALFGDEEMGGIFREAYSAVETHLVWRGWHVEVDMLRGNQGSPSNYRVSALQAFWPSVQAAAGDLEAAESTYDLLLSLWRLHKALPDFYDARANTLMHYGRNSPLRPELAESTLALYRATGDNQYLEAGAEQIRALQGKNRVRCGYASIGDVNSGVLEDRMDSYFIAETLKYLFLLFDSSLPTWKQKSIFCNVDEEADWVKNAPMSPTKPFDDAARNATARNNTNSSSSNPMVIAATGKIIPLPDPQRHERQTKQDGDRTSSSASAATMVSTDRGGRRPGQADARQEKNKLNGDEEKGKGEGEGEGDVSYARAAATGGNRCLLWADTVLSTEGHPFLVSSLARAVEVSSEEEAAARGRGGDEKEAAAADRRESIIERAMGALRVRRSRLTGGVKSGFDPRHHYEYDPALDSEGVSEQLKHAELEVKKRAV